MIRERDEARAALEEAKLAPAEAANGKRAVPDDTESSPTKKVWLWI